MSGTPTTTYGDAMVAEALIYDHALTVSERQAVESALEARYGIVTDAGIPEGAWRAGRPAPREAGLRPASSATREVVVDEKCYK